MCSACDSCWLIRQTSTRFSDCHTLTGAAALISWPHILKLSSSSQEYLPCWFGIGFQIIICLCFSYGFSYLYSTNILCDVSIEDAEQLLRLSVQDPQTAITLVKPKPTHSVFPLLLFGHHAPLSPVHLHFNKSAQFRPDPEYFFDFHYLEAHVHPLMHWILL